MSSVPPPLNRPSQALSYATPVMASLEGVLVDGIFLITPPFVALPENCLKCGRPGAKRYKRQIYWHPQWIYVLILPGLLIYAIVALVLRKGVKAEISLCHAHAASRRNKIAVAWLIALAGVVSIVVGGVMLSNNEDLGLVGVLLGIVLMLAGLIYGANAALLLKPVEITNRYGKFKGAGPEFLRQFPTV